MASHRNDTMLGSKFCYLSSGFLSKTKALLHLFLAAPSYVNSIPPKLVLHYLEPRILSPSINDDGVDYDVWLWRLLAFALKVPLR